MARFEKYISPEIKEDLDNDQEFQSWKNLLLNFGIDDFQSLKDNFSVIVAETESYPYEEMLEELTDYFHIIIQVLIEAANTTNNENFANEIGELQGEYEKMNFLVFDESIRYTTYRNNILKHIEKPIREDTEEYESIKTNSDKIRLLHKIGIIDFIKSKYPNTTDNKIAKFFELLSSEPMIAKNTNSLFTTDKTNKKYLMNNLTITQKTKLKRKLNDFGLY